MIKVIHNIETGEITQVEMTAEEIEIAERLSAEAAKMKQDRIDAANKRLEALAKLEALGLDGDDLKALGL